MGFRVITDPPPITQHDGVVTVQGDALPLLYRGVIALVARYHRDGLSSPPLLHILRTELFRASTSQPRHRLAKTLPAGSCCTCQDGELVSVAAAARMLSVGKRQVQRLAERDAEILGARRIGSIWALKRSAVLALAERRKAAK